MVMNQNDIYIDVVKIFFSKNLQNWVLKMAGPGGAEGVPDMTVISDIDE